jgi:hypothetical protein
MITTNINIRVPVDLKIELMKDAMRRGVNLTDYILHLVNEGRNPKVTIEVIVDESPKKELLEVKQQLEVAKAKQVQLRNFTKTILESAQELDKWTSDNNMASQHKSTYDKLKFAQNK